MMNEEEALKINARTTDSTYLQIRASHFLDGMMAERNKFNWWMVAAIVCLLGWGFTSIRLANERLSYGCVKDYKEAKEKGVKIP